MFLKNICKYVYRYIYKIPQFLLAVSFIMLSVAQTVQHLIN
jgi:hypothetical protein